MNVLPDGWRLTGTWSLNVQRLLGSPNVPTGSVPFLSAVPGRSRVSGNWRPNSDGRWWPQESWNWPDQGCPEVGVPQGSWSWQGSGLVAWGHSVAFDRDIPIDSADFYNLSIRLISVSLYYFLFYLLFINATFKFSWQFFDPLGSIQISGY